MGMAFEDGALTQPALAGISGEITEIDEADALELAGCVVPPRRPSLIGFVMALIEAWPQTAGPFFTADGQSATCQAQAGTEVGD
ncbi:MAG: hypothetical protein H0X24_20860 [Ktedonobacterales bacterium]|nr:hypothetical protein [Ktedonobacterales bacterium]